MRGRRPLVQDSGWYSHVSRGKRRKVQGEATTANVESSELVPSEAKRAWARLIKQAFEPEPNRYFGMPSRTRASRYP